MAHSSRLWIELSVEAHAEAVDAVAEVFRQFGTGGVAIEQPIQPHIEDEEQPILTGDPIVRAYVPLNDSTSAKVREIEGALWHLQAFDLSPIGDLSTRTVAEEDWANAWKQHFHPLVVGRIVIKPTWREWDAQPDQIIVHLDPGMAFGTGLHPTTRLMLDALQQRVQPGMRVLDLGTGSGILSIPSALMGAGVTALDISEIAVEVAQENVDTNGVSDHVEVSQGSIAAVEGRRFDLILANIIATVLADIAPQLSAALEPDGELLASGIVEERVELVRVAFTAAGLTIMDEVLDNDWFLLVARRDR